MNTEFKNWKTNDFLTEDVTSSISLGTVAEIMKQKGYDAIRPPRAEAIALKPNETIDSAKLLTIKVLNKASGNGIRLTCGRDVSNALRLREISISQLVHCPVSGSTTNGGRYINLPLDTAVVGANDIDVAKAIKSKAPVSGLTIAQLEELIDL